MSIALITTSTRKKKKEEEAKCRLFLHNSRNEIYCSYLMYSDYYSSQQRDKFTYEKMLFPNLYYSHFPFFEKLFYYYECKLRNFYKNTMLLYFYDEARSSHRRCSIKKHFLKISQYY